MFTWLKRLLGGRNGAANGSHEVELLSPADIRARAEALAREAGYGSASQAFKDLDAGELDGTPLEVQLLMLRFLQHEPTGSYRLEGVNA
jgi:hypothetical protein